MASKKKIRRRVLGASCILAALIVAGASFAWFSSSDEVTNQLTATADYGVSVVEDFTPPKDMTPGQEVNKDVAAVNTGSVGAFVRTSLVNEMEAIKRINATEALETSVSGGTTYFKLANGNISDSPMTGTTPNFVSAATPDGATKLYDLRVFGDPNTFNVPTGAIELNAIENFDTDGNKKANEVTTLMAGGQVLVQASTAVAPNEQTVRSGDDVNGGYSIIYSLSAHANNYYMYNNAAGSEGYYEVTKNQDGTYSTVAANKTDLVANETVSVAALTRDYSGTGEYKPTDDGLYIFKRSNNKYSGFYYKSGKFYALNNGTDLGVTITYDDSVVSSVSNIKFLTEAAGTPGTWTMQFGSAENDDTWTNNPETVDNYLKATYHVTGDADNTRDVIFFVKLDNNWQNNWTYVNGNVGSGAGYFYYNKKLDSGETSEKLVDSVKLDSGMKKSNFIDMTYNLKVTLDSVQVTKDQYGNETVDAVDSWTGITATPNKTNGVITTVDWTATP